MDITDDKLMNEAADEVAVAEAELRAAQDKLAAAKARMAQQTQSQAPQTQPYQGQAQIPQTSQSQQGQPSQQAQRPWDYPAAGQQPYTPPSYRQPQQPQQPQQPFGSSTAAGPQSAGHSDAFGAQPHDRFGANPYQPYGQPGYQQPYPPITGTTKDHVAAGLLAIFLGSLGIHKFYLGYNTPGFILLAVTVLGSIFTLGLAAAVTCVIAFIEGIIYLIKPQAEFERIYVFGSKEWF